jgi:putative photosynthetic complex assembly protein 2
MRQSAKLNVFLGVANLNERFLPTHLKYIFTYFTCKRMNPLLPLSVIAGVLCAIPLWQAAVHPSATDFQIAWMSLTGAILSLAVLEHILMVVPFSSERLWKWGMRS